MNLTSVFYMLRGKAAVLACLMAFPAAAQTMVPWLTRSADNGRTGWNAQETQLTQAAVISKGIARVTIIPLVGDARGMEAQPLVLPGVTTPLGVRDVLVLPSMADVVRGVDAHDGSSIWQTTLGTPVTGSKAIDMWQINQFWGCISTGVIDPDLKRLYQVCWVLPNAQGTPLPPGPASTNPNIARYFMFTLNVGDGTMAAPPVLISGSSNGQSFINPQFPRKQRSSLVETTVNGVKTILGCSGTIQETSAGAAGYCFAFDVATNSMAAMLAMTEGEGAGVWMGGQGAAADPDGNLYVITGNGDFDGVKQFGESFLKIKYTPAGGGSGGQSEGGGPLDTVDRSGQEWGQGSAHRQAGGRECSIGGSEYACGWRDEHEAEEREGGRRDWRQRQVDGARCPAGDGAGAVGR